MFWEAWRLVDDHFYGDTTDSTQRTYGAIRGSMQSLDDPYTLFVEPQQRDREEEELRGSFGGIGAYLWGVRAGGLEPTVFALVTFLGAAAALFGLGGFVFTLRRA